ncbi:MAG: hypothetical protein QOG13_1130 [Sphingomonadales bacterium]|jgi:hypothetical protein|nr:hypothetical protein [Sphingomonadales bacterium]
MTFGFYPRLGKKRGDTPDLEKCIETVVQKLKDLDTEDESPGMLLGKIQSGKTRGFVGIIALAFDQGFDLAIVLTKGTKTLSAQTVARLNYDFSEFLAEDSFTVLDIMQLPGRLTGSELKRKIILVAKKEVRNLERIKDFFDDYPQLSNKKVILIDDEADLASIRFTTNRQGTLEQGSLSEKIDALRDRTDSISFLQVTATPFSLYLQPERYETGQTGNDYVFKPKRPAFTELLPIHSGYVGGDDYFGDFEDNDPRAYLFVEVPLSELDVLRQQDRRRVKDDNILDNVNVAGLRRSIVTFVAAVCLRRWQLQEAGQTPRKYAMVIHVDTKKSAHAWQDQIMDWLFERIRKRARSHPEEIFPVFETAFEDVSRSAALAGLPVPQARELFPSFLDAFVEDDVVRERVNSDNDVMALLDSSNAELKLRTPFNIFIGGNILDRGITIPNLISFYYGRNPRRMQADTVLQHSRMYGNRDRDDLAITRFYTSRGVFDRLYDINAFENALREAFETGAHDQGVVFLQSDPTGRIRPCAPNKILLSEVVSVRPNGMLLPTSFETKSKRILLACDQELRGMLPLPLEEDVFFDLSLDELGKIIECIAKGLSFDGRPFEWEAMKSLAQYYDDRLDQRDKLKGIVATNRNLTKAGSGDKSGRSIVGTKLRPMIENSFPEYTKLVLLQQQGRVDQGWSGYPFWWPVLAAPQNTEPCVFASKIQD